MASRHLDKMWKKIDRLIANVQDNTEQDQHDTEQDQDDTEQDHHLGKYCSTHKITLISAQDNTIYVRKTNKIQRYVKKNYLVGKSESQSLKNRLRNEYSKRKRFERALLTFHVDPSCPCVKRLKKNKCFGNGHITFISEKYLEPQFLQLLPEACVEKTRMSERKNTSEMMSMCERISISDRMSIKNLVNPIEE